MIPCLFKSKKGFTLIELLVVIAIIGVLASIVLASLNTARRKGRDVRRVADLGQIRLALELYFDTARAYPTASATCDATTSRGLQVLAPTQISVIPRDPLGAATANCYAYASDGTQSNYHLGASLEDVGAATLGTDRDCTSAAAAGCGTAAYTGGFDGADGGKCLAAHSGTNCYDQTN